ncbi:hypothetical protein [Amycolatopsis saalfeldensis]|uniref:Uncharacterized protein n=1 Tax=Amycolatopsis saalfeldensis TaxID=394193 RepID=A0A1H8YJF0_9PSEU|nr:hypothetical protein [Amycolatopsis saalfeldensis]SEP52285.1 hypothetical protein SAMN04489732_119167 [Amycolatopsis saalfeldensis]
MTAPTRVAWTAIGRATGPHRSLLIATCAALALAAIADEATGYDGPGPFIYLGVALVVAVVRGRYTPLLAAVMSAFFLYGGFASSQSRSTLTHPAAVFGFTAGWVQVLSFVAAGAFAVASVIRATR